MSLVYSLHNRNTSQIGTGKKNKKKTTRHVRSTADDHVTRTTDYPVWITSGHTERVSREQHCMLCRAGLLRCSSCLTVTSLALPTKGEQKLLIGTRPAAIKRSDHGRQHKPSLVYSPAQTTFCSVVCSSTARITEASESGISAG